MVFSHDFSPESDGPMMTLLPDGLYTLQIIDTEERRTKSDDPMVNVECEVIDHQEYNGKRLYHNVSFLGKGKPGAGISTHFLKVINQPHTGTIDVDCSAWVGEKFNAKIGSREYTKRDGSKATVNTILTVTPMELPF